MIQNTANLNVKILYLAGKGYIGNYMKIKNICLVSLHFFVLIFIRVFQ